MPLAGMTAWQGLFDHGGLQAGQRVPIHGGGGGVGHFTEIGGLIDEGKVRVIVESTFPLGKAAAAQEHLEHGHVAGKVVLEIAR